MRKMGSSGYHFTLVALMVATSGKSVLSFHAGCCLTGQASMTTGATRTWTRGNNRRPGPPLPSALALAKNSDTENSTRKPTEASRINGDVTNDMVVIRSPVNVSSGGGILNDRKASSSWVVNVGVGSLLAVAMAAKVGWIPGIPLENGAYAPYTNALVAQDVGATVLSAVLAYVYIKAITWLTKKEILEPRDSRKIIHTLSGPLFILFWPLFSAAPGARFFAAVVTLVNAVRLVLAGTNSDEKDLANAVSRSGDVKEALEGPFVYVAVMTAAILAFWRTSLVGIIAISTMAAGDGMADLVGRRLGKNNKWPFTQKKSVAGSIAFAVAATLCSVGLTAWMTFTGCLELPLPMSELIPRIAAISVASAAVELLPIGDDNWTVPLSAAVLSAVFL